MQQQENTNNAVLETPEANRIIRAVRNFDAKAAERSKQIKEIEELEKIIANKDSTLAKMYALLKIDEEQLNALKNEVAAAFEAAKTANQNPLHRNIKKKLPKGKEKSIDEEVPKPEDAPTASQ